MQIDRVVVIKDINFEKLVDQMLGLRQKEYLVVAHGSRFGFFMPLVGQDGTSAMALDLGKGGDGPLKHLNDVISALEKAEVAGQDVNAWKKLVGDLPGNP